MQWRNKETISKYTYNPKYGQLYEMQKIILCLSSKLTNWMNNSN